jgi:hypothetical protein
MKISAALLILLAPAVWAAAPVLTELQPRGAELGRPFTLTVVGQYLGDGARVTSTLPAAFTPVVVPLKPGMMQMDRAAAFLVELKTDAKPGVYPIRIETAVGISNVLLFTVGTFPEAVEEESQPYSKPNRNDSIETAEAVRAAPVTLNGTLRGAERDIFRISGKAGERRVFEVEARRCGSAVDPVLRILDGSGKQLARADDSPGAGLDPRIDFTFPAEGFYYVEVTDARFSTQAQNFYRLKMGAYTYAESIFPLGGPRGKQVSVTFSGGRAGAGVATTVDLSKIDPRAAFTLASLPDSGALPMVFAVSDLPELTKPKEGLLPVPSVVNARLDSPKEVDRYQVKVDPGDKLLFELQARDLGTSRLEGVITVYDAAGKKLDSAGDKPLPEDVFAVQGTSRTSNDPFLNFTVPAGLHEIAVTVEDLALRGGPLYGYRLITRRQAEDFTLSLGSAYLNVPGGGTAMITVGADRRGWDGPIQLTVPNLPKGVTVEGGMIPREFIDANNTRSFNRRAVMTLTAAPGVEFAPQDLEVWGEAKLSDGTVLKRRARGPGLLVDVNGATAQGVVDRQRSLTAPWLDMELPVALAETAQATLEVHESGVKVMEEGVRHEYSYTWKLRGKGMPPKNVEVDVVGVRDVRVIDFKSADDHMTGTFAATTTKATDPGHYNLYVSGKVKMDDGDVAVVSPVIPFDVTGGTTSVASSQ